MKVLAFAASNSRQSINKQLVTHAANLIPDTDVEILDLNDFELPLFSVDAEAELGKPVALLATSPGPGGGKNVLAAAVSSAPFFAAEVRAILPANPI